MIKNIYKKSNEELEESSKPSKGMSFSSRLKLYILNNPVGNKIFGCMKTKESRLEIKLIKGKEKILK